MNITSLLGIRQKKCGDNVPIQKGPSPHTQHLVYTRGTPGPSPGLIEAANFVAAHLQILKRILVLHFFTQ